MKKREYTYTHRQVVEIQHALKALIVALALPGFEDLVEPEPPPTEAEVRAYSVVGTRTPPRSRMPNCERCGETMVISKYEDDDGVKRPYCVKCWQAERDRRKRD